VPIKTTFKHKHVGGSGDRIIFDTCMVATDTDTGIALQMRVPNGAFYRDPDHPALRKQREHLEAEVTRQSREYAMFMLGLFGQTHVLCPFAGGTLDGTTREMPLSEGGRPQREYWIARPVQLERLWTRLKPGEDPLQPGEDPLQPQPLDIQQELYLRPRFPDLSGNGPIQWTYTLNGVRTV
jgi:hypothetical protein